VLSVTIAIFDMCFLRRLELDLNLDYHFNPNTAF
jgi:hypothetical protein